MLSAVDRVQVVVRDRRAAAATWQALLAAEVVGEDESRVLGARRTTLQAGTSLVELLEPAGDGRVATWAASWREGLFGAVFATPDLGRMARHFDSQKVRFQQEGDALYLEPGQTHGLPAAVVAQVARPPVGAITRLYEVTNVVKDWQSTAALYTRVFGLDPTRFSPIRSELYGYEGTLALFDPPARVDRVEITQTWGDRAMDRFFKRRGASLYMCFAETADVEGLAERLRAHEARFGAAEDRPPESGLFIHPAALGGAFLGVSRAGDAWLWSGRPDLAGEASARH